MGELLWEQRFSDTFSIVDKMTRPCALQTTFAPNEGSSNNVIQSDSLPNHSLGDVVKHSLSTQSSVLVTSRRRRSLRSRDILRIANHIEEAIIRTAISLILGSTYGGMR